MNIATPEEVIYQMSELLLPPLLVTSTLLFFYASFILGCFAVQTLQRRRNAKRYQQVVRTIVTDSFNLRPVTGYRLFSHFQMNPSATTADLEIFALKLLEKENIITRVAPMLGAVAAMIPMGPTLMALADGNGQLISDNLMAAFAAVIFCLLTASITLWTASVKKRWLAEELNELQPCVGR